MKWIIGIIAFFLLIFLIFNSSSNSSTSSNNNSTTTTVDFNYSPSKNIESDQTEEDVNPPVFNGYPCTVDCSGHEAGYEWASDKGITDPDDCGGNSDSFIEGCEAYAYEQ